MPSETISAGEDDGPAPGGRAVPVLLGLLAVLILLYSLLIVQQPLLGVVAAGLVALPYALLRLARRFARAYRRRTEAVESVAASLDELADRAGTESDGGGSTGVDR